MHLAQAVGGNLFLGFISAVAFATILAVVAGLALSGASAVSHDLYACVMRKGQASEQQEMRVSRIATLCIGVLAIILGMLFEIAEHRLSGRPAFWPWRRRCNFPVLLLSMYWKGLTTRGAVSGSLTGLVSAIVRAGGEPGGVGQRAASRPGAVPVLQPGAVFHEPGVLQRLAVFRHRHVRPVPPLSAAVTWRSSFAR